MPYIDQGIVRVRSLRERQAEPSVRARDADEIMRRKN